MNRIRPLLGLLPWLLPVGIGHADDVSLFTVDRGLRDELKLPCYHYRRYTVNGKGAGDGIALAMKQLLVPELTEEIQQKPEQARMMQQTDYSVKLDEGVTTGRRRYPPRNYGGLKAPRNIQENDPRLGRAASMAQLLAPLGVKAVMESTNESRGLVFKSVTNGSKVKVFVDNVEEDDHNAVYHLQPTDVKSIEYFTPNDPQNALFGVRPEPWSGIVPGVLFIFLK